MTLITFLYSSVACLGFILFTSLSVKIITIYIYTVKYNWTLYLYESINLYRLLELTFSQTEFDFLEILCSLVQLLLPILGNLSELFNTSKNVLIFDQVNSPLSLFCLQTGLTQCSLLKKKVELRSAGYLILRAGAVFYKKNSSQLKLKYIHIYNIYLIQIFYGPEF